MASATNVIKRAPVQRRSSSAKRRENLYGYLFLTPWLIGFLGLFAGPGLVSLYLSLTKYDVISPLPNYRPQQLRENVYR